MLPLLFVVLGALATARLTRLLTADQLTMSLRRRCLQVVQEGGHLEYLLTCRWCASFWVAIPIANTVVALSPELRPDLPTRWVLGVLLTMAYSQITGHLASREVEV